MIVPDVNLLIYAYNSSDPVHPRARNWWESCLNGDESVGLPWIVINGFLRLMTHPRVLREPMPVLVATQHVRTWLKQAPVLTLEPGKRFAPIFLKHLENLGVGGNLTTDAYIAALATEHQAEVHSTDADFSRFSGLRWRNPLESA